MANTKSTSGWKTLKFSEFAQNVTVRVDPSSADTDIYVGLEHLDPESLHLRQWGHPSDVIGDKFAFKKGDVIFGRRRAYQRKLAVAEFDGICSAHAMVVRAKPKMILPEFLPFFLQSDLFMARAIEISVGSLSPTINWKTLSVQEFSLPPIEEQKRIAEILWASDDAIEQNMFLKHQCNELYLAAIDHYIFSPTNTGTKVKQLAQINESTLSESGTPKDLRFRYIDISSVTAPKIIGELAEKVFMTAPSRARRVVKGGDILLSTVRPNLKSYVRVSASEDVLIASTGFAVISPVNQSVGSILFHSFFSNRFASFCEANVTGTSYPAISAKDIGDFSVRLPKSKDEIATIAKLLDGMDDAASKIDSNIHGLRSLRGALLNTLIGVKTLCV